MGSEDVRHYRLWIANQADAIKFSFLSVEEEFRGPCEPSYWFALYLTNSAMIVQFFLL